MFFVDKSFFLSTKNTEQIKKRGNTCGVKVLLMGRRKKENIIDDWLRVPDTLARAVEGKTDGELDADGPDGLTLRETVHHIVEANIVASGIVIAALGASGSTYDWSWLYPDTAWCKRLGYDSAPVAPAIETLRALSRHIANIISASDDTLSRDVKLFDTPGDEPYSRTVEELLRQEVEHADEHLRNILKLRKRHVQI